MKKKIIIISAFIALVAGCATTEEVKKETQKLEYNIVENINDVNYEDNLNIYLFWGDGCSHCDDLKDYLNTLDDEYKETFTINMFETWYNAENDALMNDFAEAMNEEPTGVPYLIIGDKSFNGYAEVYNEEIIEALDELKTSKYDIYKEMKE